MQGRIYREGSWPLKRHYFVIRLMRLREIAKFLSHDRQETNCVFEQCVCVGGDEKEH